MYVCNCNAITESEVRGAIELGCSTLDALQEQLGVATRCGRCRDEATELLGACSGQRCPRDGGPCARAAQE